MRRLCGHNIIIFTGSSSRIGRKTSYLYVPVVIYPDGNDQMDHNSFQRSREEFLSLTDENRKRAVRRKGYKNRIRPIPSKIRFLNIILLTPPYITRANLKLDFSASIFRNLWMERRKDEGEYHINTRPQRRNYYKGGGIDSMG